jgi:hypothetical protein
MTDRPSLFLSDTAGAALLGLLLPEELAKRWRITARTLQRWRAAGSGPAYLRIGRRVVYRLSDVERFETAQVCAGNRT